MKESEHQLFRASSIHIHSTGARCWWQQPLLLPGFLSAGCGKKHKHKPSLSPRLISTQQESISLLTALLGLGILCPGFVSDHGCTSRISAYFLLPALSVEMLSLQTAHSFHHFVVTWSRLLPNKGDHLLQQLRAQQLPQAAEWGYRRVCSCVIISLPGGNTRFVCVLVCARDCDFMLFLPVRNVGLLLMPDSRFVCLAVQRRHI